MYRAKIERSGMYHNDEWVIYTTEPISPESKTLGQYVNNVHMCHPHLVIVHMCHPHLVICRPVFDVEIQDGLVILKNPISTFDEKIPNITHFLDDLFEMKYLVESFKRVRKEALDWDFIKYLVNRYASAYYVCMAGGVGGYSMSLIKEIVKIGNIDLDMQIYPGKDGGDGWYTLGDTLNHEWPDIDPMLKRLQTQIPCVSKFLTE
jgi:hypothetical protein